MTIRAILFDLDDTLYDRGAAFRAWAEGYVRTHCAEKTPEEQSDAVAELIIVDAGGYGDRAALVSRMMRLAPAIGTSPAAVLEKFRAEFVQKMALSPATCALLDRLDASGIPYGIITNGSTHPQQRKIVHLGLDQRTDCIFISEAFGTKKPDVRIFLAAAERLRVSPTEILFVGDHPENDVIGAQRTGMQSAWLGRGAAWSERTDGRRPDFQLHELTDIEAHLAQMR